MLTSIEPTCSKASSGKKKGVHCTSITITEQLPTITTAIRKVQKKIPK